jgi:protein-disulfide isomerase
MTDLSSALIPPLADDDHVRGPRDAPLLIEYGDFECPYCAVLHVRLTEHSEHVPLRHVFRHFPVRSAHPRAQAAACASEAAALQGRFWEMHDLLLRDQAHLEDPHLWERAKTLGLDVERFDSDRRSDSVVSRVKRDFTGGVRGGVVTTPTVVYDGAIHTGDSIRELLARLAAA